MITNQIRRFLTILHLHIGGSNLCITGMAIFNFNLKFVFLIFVILLTIVSCYIISDYLINYKTWGDNKEYFLDDYHGWTVTCDVNYFAEPSNCRVVDEDGQIVPNEIILAQNDHCYSIESDTDRILPCRGLS